IAKLSSAHVYLRMPDGMTWDVIPDSLLTDLAQLVKVNSIEGILLRTSFSRLQIIHIQQLLYPLSCFWISE
ncbi:hypothetical protein K435DRAFT_706723, partial [Dendrothele bispora CBS 962.96]